MNNEIKIGVSNLDIRDRDLACISYPVYAGIYRINETLLITFIKKPNWWHRLWTRILLGWKWEDTNENN